MKAVMKTNHPIVVVGGGFGGVYTVRELLKRKVPVLLISETNYFTFTPLLHEVATGILSSEDITFEYASFFHDKRFSFIRGRVEDIDFKQQTVLVDGAEIPYKDVVLATGASTAFYAIKGREHLFELKTIEDAAAIKKRMIELGQGVEGEVHVSVIGGGPTGIELVFEMDLFLQELKRNNPRLDYRLRVIQLGSTVLTPFPERVQQRAMQLLTRRGIELELETSAQEVTADAVKTDKGTFPSNLTIMAAGVSPNTHCLKEVGLERGHVNVDGNLRIKGEKHGWALGDIICLDGAFPPKLAQTATAQARVVAENILRTRSRRSLQSYAPRVRGSLISFGYRDGAGVLGPITFFGPLAWFIWRTVYLVKTPGFYNKVRVSFAWTVELFQRRNLVEE